MCGLIFGWGLLISEMTQPTKVIGFLDVFGTWDPSLGVVMAAALAVSSIGFRYAASRACPVLAPKSLWPSRTEIDPPLVIGAMLFGIGGSSWGCARDQPWKILRRSPLALSPLSWPWRSAWFCIAFGRSEARGPERLHAPTAVMIDG